MSGGLPASSVSARLRRVWALRGIWLGALTWAVAWVSQGLLPDPASRAWALALTLLAGLLAGVAWWGFALHPAPYAVARSLVGSRSLLMWWAGVGAAAALVVGANVAYLASPQDAFGLAGWLWLGGIAAVIVVAARWPSAPVEEGPLDIVAPLVASGGVPMRRARNSGLDAGVHSEARATARLPVRLSRSASLASSPEPQDTGETQPMTASHTRWLDRLGWPAWEVALAAGLVLLALLLRLWDLQNIPFAIHPDEQLIGDTAIDSYMRGTSVPLFSTQWERADLSALWFALVAASLKVGGVTLAALRFPAAFFGGLTALPLYLLLRDNWGRASAIAGTALFAFGAASIHYSRVTLNNILPAFFWASCFFLLLRGVRQQKPLYWALAGVAAGLGEHTYYGNRLVVFILIVFCAWLLLARLDDWRLHLRHFVLLGLGYLAAFGPLLTYFLKYRPDLYFGRGQGLLTWDHIPRDLADLRAMWQTLWPLFSKNLLGFSIAPSVDGVYWSPLLLTGEAALLALGIALLLRQIRYPASLLMLLAGIGVIFVGGTLVRGTGEGQPFIAHWTAAFPVFYGAMGIAAGAWVDSWRPLGPRARLVGSGLVAAGLVLAAWVNIYAYYRDYVTWKPDFQVHTIAARWSGALGPGYAVYTVGHTWQPYDESLMKYVVPGQVGGSLPNPGAELPQLRDGRGGLAFLFYQDNTPYREITEAYFPGGTEGQVESSDGKHLFDTYTVTPEQLAGAPKVSATQGLLSTWSSGGVLTHSVSSLVGFTDIGLLFPQVALDRQTEEAAAWSGWFTAPRTGTYTFELLADAPTRLTLATSMDTAIEFCTPGGPASAPADMSLTAGQHELRLDYSGTASARLLELYWTPPGGVRGLVPPGVLSHDELPSGSSERAYPTVLGYSLSCR